MDSKLQSFRSTMRLKVDESMPSHEALLRRRCNNAKRHGQVQVYAPHLRTILDELDWYRSLWLSDGLEF